MKNIQVDQIINATQFSQRLLGFMFQKKPKNTKIIIFDNCNSIHTFNMKFKIDVLFLNDNSKVVHVIRALPKHKIIFPVRKACKVIEAAEGTFDAIFVGDVVSFRTFG